AADASPMLVVYPRAPAPALRYEVDPPPGRASADVLLFDAILARLRERFAIDPRRVYSTGFSNGAAFCYRLAAGRPSVVAAIAPVAGYLPDLSREGTTVPVPVLHVHGTADERVGASDDPVATWARWNGATKGPVRDVLAWGGLRLRRSAYSGASPRSDA